MAFSYGLRIGKYEVHNKLGHGGYGIVYAARDTELGRDIAIKFLRPDYAGRPQVLHRFLQEARSAAKIVHPGIITVYECGYVENTNTIADGTVYIAMELLQGESLAQRIEGGRLEIDVTIEIGIQLAAALEAAHKSGIVHRDLKPDNIFLVPDKSLTSGQRIKILDFGVAKLADTEANDEATGVHTHSMMMLGTPRYMSPEQCRSSARVDHRSDIYAMGCILFELACGASPYDGDVGELIAKHQLAPVPRPRMVRPEVPAYFDVLVSTMMAKDPNDRPPSMERVRHALVACAEGGAPPAEMTPDATTPQTTLRGSASETSPAPRRARNWTTVAAVAGTAALGVVAVIVLITSRGGGTPKGGDERRAALDPPNAVAVVVPAPPDVISEEDKAKKELECRQLAADRRWDELLLCADQLTRLGEANPAARELTTMAVIEERNATCFGKLEEAVTNKDAAEAYRWLDRIDDESVYKDPATDAIQKLEAVLGHPVGPARKCNADKLASRAQQSITQGQYTAALSLIEGSLRCRPDPSLYRLALLAACNGANAPKAKLYYGRLPAAQRGAMVQLCLRNKISLP
jgi:tRNA A-37 threonylcarbamoyl transferase component Bud32